MKKMEEKYDNNFLARWLNDDITAEERTSFEQSPEYKQYIKIIEGVDQLEAPSFDRQHVFTKIQEELQDTPTTKVVKTRKLIPTWAYAVAASLVLLLGLGYTYIISGTTYETGYGDQMTIVLPDGSEAILNSKSTLEFDKRTWNKNRKVTLAGEAFFKVTKGEKFTVVTTQGEVEVLGTQFNVCAGTDFFEVKCREGKVKATSITDKSAILTQGKAFSVTEKEVAEWDFDTDESSWMYGESTFKNRPLRQVMLALGNQFEIEFILDDIDVKQRFTGSFSHKNLKLALKTVFVPMEISYTFRDEKTIVLEKAK